MSQFKTLSISLLSVLFFIACSKNTLEPAAPGNPGNQNPNPGSSSGDSSYVLRVKAEITIGDIVYDSIPATLEIKSWDSSNVLYQRQVILNAGNNEIRLSSKHARYQFRIEKWGVIGDTTFTKSEIAPGTLLRLGGSKNARKLKSEESFLFVNGNYQPDSKSIYSYKTNGSLNKIEYYQKKAQSSELKLLYVDDFFYSANHLEKISRKNDSANQVGITTFTYAANGKIGNIHQESYGNNTYAAIEYGSGPGSQITIDYLFDNGNTMEYQMTFKGGNKIQDVAVSSRGGGEGGVYGYDQNINPFAHINLPSLFLTNLSKNNLVSQEKSFSGSIPTSIPYKFEYIYDGEGYPVELVRSFKSISGEHLFKIKTIYTY